jgi:hypothetical protein
MTGDVEAILETGGAAALEIAASALAQHGARPGKCVNCGQPLIGTYCAACGQPSVTGRRSVHALLYAFVKDVVNFDSRILRTARALLFEPGELPAAFRRGQTQPYVPAIRLYLFVSLVFFVLLGVTNIALLQLEVTAKQVPVIWDAKGNPFIKNPAYDPAETDLDIRKAVKPLLPIPKVKANRPGGFFTFGTKMHFFSSIGVYHSALPAAARRQLLDRKFVEVDGPGRKTSDWIQGNIYDAINRIAADPAALNGPLTTWIPRALFLLLPLYALLLALFHIRRRQDYYLVDHLVFSFSIHTFAFVALMLAVALAQMIVGDLVPWLTFAVISLYIFLAMKRFYRQGWFMTSVKFIAVSCIYTIFFLLPALAGVLLLSVFGGSLG